VGQSVELRRQPRLWRFSDRRCGFSCAVNSSRASAIQSWAARYGIALRCWPSTSATSSVGTTGGVHVGSARSCCVPRVSGASAAMKSPTETPLRDHSPPRRAGSASVQLGSSLVPSRSPHHRLRCAALRS